MELSRKSIANTQTVLLPKMPDTSRWRFLEDAIDLFSGKQSGHMLHQCYVGEGMTYWDEFMRQSDEYYITQTETAIIEDARNDIANLVVNSKKEPVHLIELGPGSRRGMNKTLKLCEALPAFTYHPRDWSDDTLEVSQNTMQEFYPDAEVLTKRADFCREDLSLPEDGMRLVVMFGSSLSNIAGFPHQGVPLATLQACLSNIRLSLKEGDVLLLGIDQNQEGKMLEAMYAHPMHKAFSENILHRMAAHLPVYDFHPESFVYEPKWHPQAHLLSHDLVAQDDMDFQLGRERFSIHKGQRFSYSNSFKYPDTILNDAFTASGFKGIKKWPSADNTVSLFAVQAC
jgi:uncharacterized SAM-dependent methyltransferase